MKFSWTMLNYFINLESITFEKFIEKLTLTGFEVEKIEENTKIADKIVHLSITANRKEIFCIVNIAKEIANIFNLPLKINLNPIQLLPNNTIYNFINTSQQILYIKINTISNLLYKESPQWLQNNLIGCNINPLFLLHDIQKYIQIKWGHEILIFDLDKLNIKYININLLKINRNISIQKQETIVYNNQNLFYLDIINSPNKTTQFSNKTKNIILCCFINKMDNLANSSETFTHAYNETIRLIATYSGGVINKSYENTKININNNKKLKIEKNEIKNILGPIINKNNKFLSNKNIFKALNQLKLKPSYSYNYKMFEITIPKYREHDLKRSIDIIEEIGRIYGFKYFLNKLPKYNRKGKISIKSFYIKKIRHTLLNIGFDEAINSSLTQNEIYKDEHIQLYNPIAKEQNGLRLNISKSLIENYRLHLKQKNSRIEIFEIGNIFYKDKKNLYNEQIHLGGIINNLQFSKKDWYSKSNELEWFHAKGVLEFILDTLQTNIEWRQTLIKASNITIKNIQDYLDPNQQIFIYNKNNDQLIGILGKVHKKYTDDIDQYKKTTYLFEINIQNLINSIYFNKQISHTIKPYSLYPSVIRDISINITKNDNIKQIKNLLLNKDKHLIEYIEIINEYYNKVTKIKSICLRIIYRSSNRTLDNKDLININNTIKKLLLK